MSSKNGPQTAGRRTPLSLTKFQIQQQLNRSPNGSNSNSKSDKALNQKAATQPLPSDIKEANSKDNKKQPVMDNTKSQQQQSNSLDGAKKLDKIDEKKVTNTPSKNNGNSKEKQQNGNDQNGNPNGKEKDKKEKSEKTSKNDKDKEAEKKESDVEKKTPETEKNLKETDPVATEKIKFGDKIPIVLLSSKTLVDKKKTSSKNLFDTDTSDKSVEVIATATVETVEKVDPESLDQKAEKTSGATPGKSSNLDVQGTPTKAAPGTPTNAGLPTPTKQVSASPMKSVGKRSVAKAMDNSTASPVKNVATMEPIEPRIDEAVLINSGDTELAGAITANPAATSTPGKLPKKKTVDISEAEICSSNTPDRSTYHATFTQISGRRSIRSNIQYTPSNYQSNLPTFETYRRTNYELFDATSNTNTSLDVTVGSEVPNNSSFSFFGVGRKREHISPTPQSSVDLQTDHHSPPKRARTDGFLSVMASPLTLFRSRFARATIQDNTTPKPRPQLNGEDVNDVQNISGVSIEEENEMQNVGNDAISIDSRGDELLAADSPKEPAQNEAKQPKGGNPKRNAEPIDVDVEAIDEDMDDITFKETPFEGDDAAPVAKNKRCIIM